ncbi:DoxX family membrane protein [Ascidiimonas aurantiaca]|uniref:DoxX family membrane protein n=1 Tax=Ascidiimonas aurantiaca TaxID=1685432 RepID=UPI0030EC3057
MLKIKTLKTLTPLLLRMLIAVILLQTLRFKFSAHPDSVYIFTKTGIEPYGRIATGIVELIAAILLLLPRTIWIGALMTLATIGGAIIMHLTLLGIEVNNDGGALFLMALVTFILSAIVLWHYKEQIPLIAFSR